MTARAEFDVGPLSWVKGEIDHAIDHAQKALRAFAANSSDAAQLKSSQTHLHQAHGALSIVGLEGITRISEELEALLGAIEKEVSLRKADVFGLAERALAAIRVYLDQLMAGKPNQPLRLFPLYRDVVRARGGRADPTDLYYPNLSFRPPKRDKSVSVLKPGEAEKSLREQRGHYQRGLLKWLKKDPSGAEDMRAAVEAVEALQGPGAQRAFWWVALAFFDALAHEALPEDLDAKQVCNRIEQQIKRLVEGAPSVSERQLREVLYCVARAKPATERIRQVQEGYHLGQSIPPTEGEGTGAEDSQALKSAREHLAHAKDAWNKFASGNAAAVATFRESSGALKESAAQLGDADLAGLSAGVAELATWMESHRDSMSEAIALEVATVLLLLENALAGTSDLSGEFAKQARFLRSRLQDCMQGKLEPAVPDMPLLDEMSRKAAERLVMNQVVSEMQANLRAIEQVLDVFFRDPAKRDELASLDKPMRQLLGALEMLGEKRARDTFAATVEDIRSLSAGGDRAGPQEFERIAQTLSGLGFYIESLGLGNVDFDTAMRPIASSRGEEGEAAPQAATVEAHIVEQKRETAGLYEEWKGKPEDAELKAELKKNLAELQKEASLVADQKLEASAAEALKALDKTATMPLTPFLKEAIEKATSTAAPAPSPEAAKLIDASAEAVDAELLGVYLEESDEVLATIRDQLEIVREHHANKDALVTIRRGFHTLKGSGRMVGLMRLGEAAWAVEQTMNVWLQDERAATPPLLQLIGLAHEYFTDNVRRLKAGESTSDERPLVAAAERVRRGEAPERAAAAVGPLAAPAEVQAGELAIRIEPTAEPAAEPEEFVQLGAHRVSTTLFTIFSGEARAHIAAIKEEHETLRQHGVVSDALLRAVHTLAGTSGTVKISALSDLGYALERALQVLSSSELSEAEQLMVGEAIDTLEAMVSGVVELRVPQPVPSLIALLERVGEGAGASLPEAGQAGAADAPASYAAEPELAEPASEIHEADPAAEEGALEDLELEITPERRQRRLDDDLDPELMQIFLDEAHELVPSVGAAMRDWRDNPDNPALGQALQRVLHTLKGSSRMAGAMAMGELTHHMETRVENALAVKTLPASLFEDLETSWDRMGVLFDRLQKSGGVEVAAPAPEMPPAPAERPAAPKAVVPAPVEVMPEPAVPAAPKPVPPSEREMQPKALLRVRADVVDRLVNEAGEVAIARSRIEGEMRTLKGAMQELTDNVARLRAQLREIEIQAESQMQSRLELAKETQRNFDPLEFDRFTRFQEVTRLMAESVNDVSTVHGNLVTTVDETEKALLAQARLNRDLQQDLMRVRMVPFGSLQERLYRIVRQTAKEVGKRANLEIKGTQVELDRSVLERITGPFEHLLRNAVAHGIETPQARRAAGKADIGEIRLELKQEGNEVQLALSDDGAGLNIERIREKAIEKGLMQANSNLTESEIADFIFHAGFSTAEQVSQLAGRGVGMDVVRNEVAALGGRVEMRFTKGQGTRFTIFLPLTLAVTQTVLVRAGSRTYAIPAVMVEQVLQLRQEQLVTAYAQRQTVWQDRHYPFHYLPHLLGQADAVAEQKRFSPTLYLRSGTNSIALHVDDMVGSNQEIVVKAIGPQLQRIAGITGATVLGTGEIVLILNPVQLALKEVAVRPAIVHEAPKPQAAATQPTIMVVDDSLTVRKVTGRLLERQGYLVVTARDGVEAMEKLQEMVPDVMLVDIEMPRMDGFDLTRNVRADARLARVPVIMITSRTADKHQNYAKEIGVSHFLGKPYQEDDLLEKISGFLRERRAAA
ncbi:MAG TPA: Hpt domain-containing protein [Burkholderiales bacterium]|nr:Hpt domain-containing protein [Burkholderiales bacterium]HYA46965.1 Hpt domain-containing protein [Burkholderiales bacterium]